VDEHWAGPNALFSLSALADPVRRQLYEYVASQGSPVRRDDAAEAAGVSRTLAAYHLDRLAEAGLLAISYARPEGQGGPGAGRPAKLYRRMQDEVSVTVPPRSYGLLAQLFADAVASDESGDVRVALMAAAETEGRTAAGEGADLLEALIRRGYEPVVTDDGHVGLRNCPFHQLAQRHAELVCGLNHALLRGVLAGCGGNPDRAELAPRPGRCCVTIHPAASVPGDLRLRPGPAAAPANGTGLR
jgi:predicted ArsR family transcriptional regulator